MHAYKRRSGMIQTSSSEYTKLLFRIFLPSTHTFVSILFFILRFVNLPLVIRLYTRLPCPWRVVNVYQPSGRYFVRRGRTAAIKTDVVQFDRPLPVRSKTTVPAESELSISHGPYARVSEKARHGRSERPTDTTLIGGTCVINNLQFVSLLSMCSEQIHGSNIIRVTRLHQGRTGNKVRLRKN